MTERLATICKCDLIAPAAGRSDLPSIKTTLPPYKSKSFSQFHIDDSPTAAIIRTAHLIMTAAFTREEPWDLRGVWHWGYSLHLLRLHLPGHLSARNPEANAWSSLMAKKSR